MKFGPEILSYELIGDLWVPKRKRKTGTKKIVKKSTKKATSTKKTPKSKAKKKVITKTEEITEPIEEKPIESKPSTKIKSVVKHDFIPTPKIWPDHLTKYERSRIIGARALQISMGAPILIEELEKIGNPVEVAEKELEYGILPITIRRILPDGEIVDIPLQELLEHE